MNYRDASDQLHLKRHISADYSVPKLRPRAVPTIGLVAVFTQGASGDQNPRVPLPDHDQVRSARR